MGFNFKKFMMRTLNPASIIKDTVQSARRGDWKGALGNMATGFMPGAITPDLFQSEQGKGQAFAKGAPGGAPQEFAQAGGAAPAAAPAAPEQEVFAGETNPYEIMKAKRQGRRNDPAANASALAALKAGGGAPGMAGPGGPSGGIMGGQGPRRGGFGGGGFGGMGGGAMDSGLRQIIADYYAKKRPGGGGGGMGSMGGGGFSQFGG